MISHIPHEFSIWGIYMPPLLVVGLLGSMAGIVTSRLLGEERLSRLFFHPPLVTLALMIIYTLVIGTFIIRV